MKLNSLVTTGTVKSSNRGVVWGFTRAILLLEITNAVCALYDGFVRR